MNTMASTYKTIKNRKKWKDISWAVFLAGIILALASILAYLIINFPALSEQAVYTYKNDIKKEAYSNNVAEVVPTVSGESEQKEANDQSPALENNHLYIQRIGVDAPIIFDVKESEAIPKLKYGVVQLTPSAHPGEPGNVVISGHSSYFWWDKGKYNHVFTLLNKLKAGDLIIIRYNDKTYSYKVTKYFVTSADDGSVFKAGEKNSLTLSTCTPVGTTISRLIVRADEITPNKTPKATTSVPQEKKQEQTHEQTKKPTLEEGLSMMPEAK